MLEALVEAALRTLLLTALVKLGLWLLRIKRAQLLLIAWTVVLAASLAMPALQWVTPFRLPVFPDLPSTSLIGAADPQPQSFVLNASQLAFATEIQQPATTRLWLEAVYLVVSSILLLRLTVALALSLRLLGKAASVRLDWTENAHVRISRYVAAPVTVANVILLPSDALDWPSTMRQAVLAHEHAHVARWDFAMLLLSQVNRALFWFNPLSWWLHRRLAALAELASDDHAMEVTGDRPGYAEVLLEMGRRSGPVLRGLAMARPATLRYRIERILSDHLRPNPISPIHQVILAVGAAGLSIAAASSEPNSAPPSGVTAFTEQQKPPTPPHAIPSLSALEAEGTPEPIPLPQPRTEMASKALRHLGTSVLSDLPTAISRSRPIVRAVARQPSKPMTRNSLATQLSLTVHQPNPISNGDVAPEASMGAKAVNSVGLSQTIVGPDSTKGIVGAADERHPAPSHELGYLPESARPVLRLINDRTCTGVYVSDHASGVVDGGINLVRAKLFRDASGTSWLTFFLGGQAPVIQPVTVRQGEDKVTALQNTVFTMVPRSARHLNGFIKRPYGTIDFDCGGPDPHIFDEG